MDFVISRLSAESCCPSETHILRNEMCVHLFSAHESAELKKVFGPVIAQLATGWLARRVHHWCVLRPADWHNIVCESSGLLGQQYCQHRPAQRPTGRGSTAVVVQPDWY